MFWRLCCYPKRLLLPTWREYVFILDGGSISQSLLIMILSYSHYHKDRTFKKYIITMVVVGNIQGNAYEYFLHLKKNNSSMASN